MIKRAAAILCLLISSLFSVEEQSFPCDTEICHDREYKVFAFGEFINWRYSSPNLVYGRSGVGSTQAPISKAGTSYYPHFDYKSGFRTGLGVKFGQQKAFDLVLIYTSLHQNPKSSVHASSLKSPFLPLNFFNSPSQAVYRFASLDLDLRFKWLEIQSGYTFNPNKYLTLRPYIALQSVFAHGDLHAEYDFTTGDLLQIAHTKGHCDSWSIGPRMGMDFIVHLTKNWGIFSTVFWTQQASNIHMSTNVKQVNTKTDVSTVIQKGKLDAWHNAGLLALELGLTWDVWFQEKYRFQLRGTWSCGTLITGVFLSFLNNNNQDIVVNSEFRGYNIRATFEF